MKDIIEAASALLKQHFGVEPDPSWVPYVVIGVTMLASFAGIYRWTRRQMGDVRALSSELHAVTRVISEDTEPKFQQLLKDFSKLHKNLEANVTRRLDSMHITLQSINPVTSRPDDAEVDSDAVEEKKGRFPRLKMAESVRETVLEKWFDGRILRPTSDDPGCFEFSGVNADGEEVELHLQTPYRRRLGVDGRLPYTLEIWAGKYKKLNFEWDTEGNYALRGFKKGDWIEDVTSWNFVRRAEGVALRSA